MNSGKHAQNVTADVCSGPAKQVAAWRDMATRGMVGSRSAWQAQPQWLRRNAGARRPTADS
jgi:hypothetical protein